MRQNFLVLFVISKERDALQRQHILVVITHLVIVVLPHLNKFIAVNQTNEFSRTRRCIFSIRRIVTRSHKKCNVASS